MNSILYSYLSKKEVASWLTKHYVEGGLSLPQCAAEFAREFGVEYSPSVFYNAIADNGISSRNISESKSAIYYEGESFLDDPDASSVVNGLLLSDGSISKYPRLAAGSTCKDFVEYLGRKLEVYEPVVCEGGVVHRGRKVNHSLNTKFHPDFEHYYEQWYYGEEGKKKVPRNLILDPLMLKVWYYGDGSIVNNRSSNSCTVRLHTDGFDTADVEFLVLILDRDLGIKSKRVKNNRIRIAGSSISTFFRTIGRKSDFPGYAYKFDVDEWRFWTPMKQAAEQLGLPYSRLSHLVSVDAVDYSRSPGGKKVMFNEEQMEKLRSMSDTGLLTADGRSAKVAATKNKCRKDNLKGSPNLATVERVVREDFPYVKLSNTEIVINFNRLRNVPVLHCDEGRIEVNTRDTELCMHFHPHMFSMPAGNAMTPLDAFSSKDILRDVIAQINEKRAPASPDLILRAILSHDAVRRTSLFPVRLAKTIINRFGRNGMRILDPCAGFSSRLLGFYASDFLEAEYVGIDSCRETVSGLEDTVGVIGPMCDRKDASIIHGCAEDVMPSMDDDTFDMVFTCPPYFDHEKYSNDELQSHVRYPEYEVWLEKFLFPIVDESVRILKPGGHLSVVISNMGKYEMADHFELYARTKLELQDIIMLYFPHRWQKVLVEPLFVFRKPE